MSPQRIQLKRTKGWRKPEGAIVVARPSVWGNPYRVSRYMGGWSIDGQLLEHFGVWETRESAVAAAVQLYRERRPLWLGVDNIREELRGHDLACWCPLNDQPCHADVLLEIANGGAA